MNDTLDTIQQASQSVVDGSTNGSQIWMIIAIAEFVCILFLLLKGKEKTKCKTQLLKEEVLKEGAIDFGNTMKSAFHSKELYEPLIRACHPDRFPNDDQKQAIASGLSQRITESKLDYAKLAALKEEAEQKLHIRI